MNRAGIEKYTVFGIPLVRLFLIAISILIVVSVMWYFSSIITYVLIAWVISLLGEPMMRFLLNRLHFRKLKIGRDLAAITTVLLFISVILLLLFIFIPPILTQAGNLSAINPNTILKSLDAPISNVRNFLVEYGLIDHSVTSDEIGRQLFKDYLNFGQFSTILSSAISSVGKIAVGIASVIFISFFFLKEDNLFRSLMVAIVPTERERAMNNAINETSSLLRRYFGGMFINIIIFSLTAYIGLIVIGVPNAALLGFFGGITNTIPYIGPFIGGLFAIVMTLTSHVNEDFYSVLPLLIKVGVVFWICQLIDNYLLQPIVYGKSVKAHPLEIFLVVLAGAKIGGVIGMFLAIPVYTVLRVMALTFFSEFKLVQKITKSIKKKEEEVPRDF